MLMTVLLFSACTDEKDTIYQQGQKPTLNSPSGYYLLKKDAKPFIMETFTWTKGSYGFSAGPVFALEASLTEDFATPVELSSANTPYAAVTVAKMNEVMLAWKIAPDVAQSVYIRVKATLNDLGTLKEYSDPTLITVVPFEDAPAVKTTLYIVGNALDPNAQWANDASKIGTGLVPMFTDVNKAEDETYTYTGFFHKGEFKFIVTPGDWAKQYGLKAGALVKDDGGSGNISVAADGYYTLVVDTKNLTWSMVAYDASAATSYTKIGLIGAFNGWGADFDLTVASWDPHIWHTTYTQTDKGELKFRANADWGVNWGGSSLPFGKGDLGGGNINLPVGKYFVQLNTITGHYMFLPIK